MCTVRDLNADPFIGKAWNHLTDFMEYNDLTCFDVNMLDSQSFTIVVFNNFNTKWLDHVVGAKFTEYFHSGD